MPALPAPLAETPWAAHLSDIEDALDALSSGPEPTAAAQRLARLLAIDAIATRSLEDSTVRTRLVAIAGASRALTDVAAALRSDALAPLSWSAIPTPAIDPASPESLRHSVQAHLLGIAALDLTGVLDMPEVGRALADLADATAVAALERLSPTVPMAAIALGKWGGRELNYASDIDLVFVHEGDSEAAIQVAAAFTAFLSDRTADGIAFRVDTDLRPEGRSGPLSRTLDSYRSYWERWAQAWEFQALLKARPVAGDLELGSALVEASTAFVFPDRLGADAVREIRTMKTRAESMVGEDELKRGIGGIRDVEFAVQLLQLVHGRHDADLRSANTLDALEQLGEGGYLRSDDAASLADAYRWLRTIEHRIQLYDLRQTHSVPAEPDARERLARASGYRDNADRSALDHFEKDLIARRSLVRTIHERLYYRPLLEAFADASADDRIDRQLVALGFTDSDAARQAVADLTAGLSRRSRLMEQLLPVMMGWLSESPDPDLGLAQLRSLVVGATDTDPVIATMRDNPVAAERLCRLLGTARAAGRLVDRIPAALPVIGGEDLVEPLDRERLIEETISRIKVRGDQAARVDSLHRFWGEHLLETMAADVSGLIDEADVARRLSDGADALVAGSLQAASLLAAEEGLEVPPIAVIAFGKWGGRELTYAGDIDGMVVFDGEGEAAAARVTEILLQSLSSSNLGMPPPRLDLDLRPEGTKGSIARSLESYEEYWDRWALTWERQALLRARAAAGDPELGERFVSTAALQAYREDFGEDQVREIRALKARMEQERIPLGEDPDFHVKLGRGGLSDIEWTAQLLQMQHGFEDESVRGASTVEALEALGEAGYLSPDDTEALLEAYRFCTRVRNRLTLRAGRTRDSLPTDAGEESAVARSLGYEVNPRTSLREEYRRVTRRARRITEKVVFGRG